MKTHSTPLGDVAYWTYHSDAERPWLVFLPGLTADHRLFEKQIPAFQQRYNIFVWDAPGHGQSRPFRLEFTLAEMADCLKEILKAEGIENPFLIGQSMGGYIAQCFRPEEMAGFISIDSAPLLSTYVTAPEIWALRHAGLVFRRIPWEVMRRAGARGCATSDYGRRLMLEMIDGYTRTDYARLAGHGYRIIGDALETNLAHPISRPILLLCGQKDSAGAIRRNNKRWAADLGVQVIWVPGAGHNSNTDNPDFVNQQITEFLEEHSG